MIRLPMEQSKKPLVRVTMVEAFRRYIEQSEHDGYDITEQSIIDSIAGEFQGNQYTRIGTAFHAIVETGCQPCELAPAGYRTFTYYGKEKQEPVAEGRTFDIEGYKVTLDLAQIKVALDYRYQNIEAFHEIRKYKDYGRAVVTGCADVINGVQLRDIKTKYSTPSDKQYYDSCQWKFYLEMFGADIFDFDLFTFEGYKLDKHGYDVRGLPLIPHTPPIRVYRYEGMEQDNLNLLNQFLDWCDYRGLTQYLYNTKV